MVCMLIQPGYCVITNIFCFTEIKMHFALIHTFHYNHYTLYTDKLSLKQLVTFLWLFFCPQVKMSLQLYQVDQKSFLLDFKSLNTMDHPDATRVKRMTMRSMGSLSETAMGEYSVTESICTETCRFPNMPAPLLPTTVI